MTKGTRTTDVVIIGAGHNGLVAALLLARKGLKVTVLEEREIIGGATKTEYPFAKAPKLGTSTASYLLGVMPPELMEVTGVKVPTLRRDPHYFLPTQDGRYLLFGKNKTEMRERFLKFFSEADWRANEALSDEIGKIREDLAPAWMEAPLSVEATAEKYVRPELRDVFINLVQRPVEEYLARFHFRSELLLAMHAVTDGFSGLTASFGTPGTGLNFLVHNMCRLPGSDGTFMIAQGGMGTVARLFSEACLKEGVEILTSSGVEQINVTAGKADGVILKSGLEIRAKAIVCNADPFRMRELVGRSKIPAEFNAKLDKLKRYGTTMKVNLALSELPKFKCLPEDKGQHNATIHLLPPEKDVMKNIRKGFDEVQAGRLAEFPTIEWYIHTQADPSLRDDQGRHSSAFFVQWVPYQLSGGKTWEQEEEKYVSHLFDIAESFCPGFRKSVVDSFTLTPAKIEKYIGISYGHIHHVDNTFGFDQRVPYATPVPGLYSCSAGTHPAGAVIGANGHNAAQKVAADLGV